MRRSVGIDRQAKANGNIIVSLDGPRLPITPHYLVFALENTTFTDLYKGAHDACAEQSSFINQLHQLGR